MGRRPKHLEIPKENINNDITEFRKKLLDKAKEAGGTLPPLPVDPNNNLFHFDPPVSPKVFIESPEYFNNKEKQVVYPWVTDVMEEIFSGPYHCPKFTTAAILAGKGSGKSWFSSLANAYMWHWVLCFKHFTKFLKMKDNIDLDPATTIQFIFMAKHAQQAKKITFDNTSKQISQVKFLRDRGWLPDPSKNSELEYSELDTATNTMFKKLIITPGNSSDTFALGYAVFAAVIDEACFWKEKLVDKVETVYNELNRRRRSRFGDNGITIMISSANVDGDFVEKMEDEAVNDPRILFKRLSVYKCQPMYFNMPTFPLTIKHEKSDGTIEDITLNPPIKLQPEYEKDLDQALKDNDAIPMLAGQPFYKDFALLMSKINTQREDPCPDLGLNKPEGPQDVYTRLPSWFVGQPGATYRIHVDLAKGNQIKGQCGVGFALAHKIADPTFGCKVKLDLAVRFKSPENKDIQVNDILQLIRDLKYTRKFDIDMVTFDQWNSMQPIQIINSWKAGIEAKEVKVDYKVHSFLKHSIYTGQFDFYSDNNLLFELKRLEDYGSEHLDHGPSSFKDESDAVAGVVYSCAALEPVEDENTRPKPRVTSPITLRSGNPLAPKRVGIYRNNTKAPKYRRNF